MHHPFGVNKTGKTCGNEEKSNKSWKPTFHF
jgi:hypothetical protein